MQITLAIAEINTLDLVRSIKSKYMQSGKFIAERLVLFKQNIGFWAKKSRLSINYKVFLSLDIFSSKLEY